MGSRSKGKRKLSTALAPRPAGPDIENDFWKNAVVAIRLAQEDQVLTWNQRAVLVTMLPARMPTFCSRHALGYHEGYCEALSRLATKKRMEFFDRDLLKRLVRVLDEVVDAARSIHRAEADSLRALQPYMGQR